MDGAAAIWQEALRRIEGQLSRPSYEAFVRAMQPVAVDRGVFTFSVPSRFAKEWLESRYQSLITDVLQSVLDHDVQVRFELDASDVAPVEVRERPALHVEGLSLNPRYAFDTFVVGSGNRFAHAAALAVAEQPARAYNPLFIYGGVGLGKTHLLQAIGHRVLAEHPLRVAYVSSEKFTNDLINSIRDDKTVEFRNRYRTVDVLLIDDIQFLQGKERTQEEFFHTFNALHEASRQIIITSDRPPKEIQTLEDRLRSRFEWGLIVDIQPPDLETRIAILRKKAEVERMSVPDEVAHYIASRIQSNIRELEGALLRVHAYAAMNRVPISEEVTVEVLRGLLPPARQRPVTIADIQRAVAEYFGIRVEEMRAKRRTKGIAFPRQVAMYLSRELTDASLPRIGEEFGGRDHTTVMHACDRVRKAMATDVHLAASVKALMERFRKPV